MTLKKASDSGVATHAKSLEAGSKHLMLLQAFLMRKLKISGSMAMAMKLQPILDAAAPKAKL